VITTYDATDEHVQGAFGITAGTDGNVWFTGLDNRIGFIQP
jgi:streptogramin lyase